MKLLSFITMGSMLLIGTMGYASVPTDHIVQPPTKPGAATQVSEELWVGLKIYERAFGRGCGACHDMDTNPDLVKFVPTLTIKQFTTILKDGKDSMPAAMMAIMDVGVVKKNKLTETEAVDALYDYLNGRFNGDIPEGKLTKIK